MYVLSLTWVRWVQTPGPGQDMSRPGPLNRSGSTRYEDPNLKPGFGPSPNPGPEVRGPNHGQSNIESAPETVSRDFYNTYTNTLSQHSKLRLMKMEEQLNYVAYVKSEPSLAVSGVKYLPLYSGSKLPIFSLKIHIL